MAQLSYEKMKEHVGHSMSIEQHGTTVVLHCWACESDLIVEHKEDLDLLEMYRSAAAERYEDEGTLEIDPDCPVSLSDDNGAYVQAWVWVDAPKLCGECEETPTDMANITSITDHGRCIDCQKKWQHGELEEK